MSEAKIKGPESVTNIAEAAAWSARTGRCYLFMFFDAAQSEAEKRNSETAVLSALVAAGDCGRLQG